MGNVLLLFVFLFLAERSSGTLSATRRGQSSIKVKSRQLDRLSLLWEACSWCEMVVTSLVLRKDHPKKLQTALVSGVGMLMTLGFSSGWQRRWSITNKP